MKFWTKSLPAANEVFFAQENESHHAKQNPLATELKYQCVTAGVPYFFKQWSSVNKKAAERVHDGQSWEPMPETDAFAD